MTIPSSPDGDTNEEMLLVCSSYEERRISAKKKFDFSVTVYGKLFAFV
jgi:hypothetical protein